MLLDGRLHQELAKLELSALKILKLEKHLVVVQHTRVFQERIDRPESMTLDGKKLARRLILKHNCGIVCTMQESVFEIHRNDLAKPRFNFERSR